MMSPDGIMRSLGPPPKRIVVDAIDLSPAQIEQTLDMQPWSQEIEDKFRGVDGRKVVDHEVLFNPPDEYRPPKWSKEEFEEKQRETVEANRKMMEGIEGKKEESVDVDAKYACGRSQADHDLSPKDNE